MLGNVNRGTFTRTEAPGILEEFMACQMYARTCRYKRPVAGEAPAGGGGGALDRGGGGTGGGAGTRSASSPPQKTH